MPKHIEGIRESILKNTRDILISVGYDRLNIRDVAARCGSSVGTVYHYFESKEMLSAAVMLADWQDTLSHMDEGASACSDFVSVLERVIDEIASFEKVYATVWSLYESHGNTMNMVRSRHGLLVDQISAIIKTHALRLGVLFDEALPGFLASMALYYAGEENYSFDTIRPILSRLFPPSAEA